MPADISCDPTLYINWSIPTSLRKLSVRALPLISILASFLLQIVAINLQIPPIELKSEERNPQDRHDHKVNSMTILANQVGDERSILARHTFGRAPVLHLLTIRKNAVHRGCRCCWASQSLNAAEYLAPQTPADAQSLRLRFPGQGAQSDKTQLGYIQFNRRLGHVRGRMQL